MATRALACLAGSTCTRIVECFFCTMQPSSRPAGPSGPPALAWPAAWATRKCAGSRCSRLQDAKQGKIRSTPRICWRARVGWVRVSGWWWSWRSSDGWYDVKDWAEPVPFKPLLSQTRGHAGGAGQGPCEVAAAGSAGASAYSDHPVNWPSFTINWKKYWVFKGAACNY